MINILFKLKKVIKINKPFTIANKSTLLDFQASKRRLHSKRISHSTSVNTQKIHPSSGSKRKTCYTRSRAKTSKLSCFSSKASLDKADLNNSLFLMEQQINEESLNLNFEGKTKSEISSKYSYLSNMNSRANLNK